MKEIAYNVRSQRAYNNLLLELYLNGYRTPTHDNPQHINKFDVYGRNTVIFIKQGAMLVTYESIYYALDNGYKVITLTPKQIREEFKNENTSNQ